MRVQSFTALLLTSMDAMAAAEMQAVLHVPADISLDDSGRVSRRVFAMAMNVILFRDLLGRVPTAAAYVADQRARNRRIVFDHGALRCVLLPAVGQGALPNGESAITRVLVPLGYAMREIYPLERLRMTGRSYAHLEGAEDIPQFFVSELHVDAFPSEFQAAASRVFAGSHDPLGKHGRNFLDAMSRDGSCPLGLACMAMPQIIACFACNQRKLSVRDYEILLASSKEAGWIATEGNAFNHATDRVDDVVAVAEEQRRLGRKIKDRIEVSRSGRVRQTAFRADPVERIFIDESGENVCRTVPGSFFELISRARLQPGHEALDLAFDSSNATGIFTMTQVA